MPVPLCCLTTLQAIPWKKILGVTILFGLNFGLMMTYLMFSDYASVSTALLVAFFYALGTSVLYYFSGRFRCALVVSVIMCFTKMGLGLFFLFGSWMFASPNLTRIIQALFDVEEHSTCMARQLNTTIELENENFLWHLSMVQLISGVVHYLFLVPVLLLVVYSFFFVFTYRVAQRSLHSQGRNENKKIKLCSAFLVAITKTGNFVVGGAFSVTIFLIYFRGIFSRMSSVEFSISDSSCALIQEETKWTLAIVYLVFSLVLLVLAQFSFYAYNIREEVMLSFYPDLKDLPALPVSAVPVVPNNQLEVPNMNEVSRDRIIMNELPRDRINMHELSRDRINMNELPRDRDWDRMSAMENF